MRNDKKKTTEKGVSTSFECWHTVTGYGYIQLMCRCWFGIELDRSQTVDVHSLLSVYPAESQDEAIETVLFIYFAKSK